MSTLLANWTEWEKILGGVDEPVLVSSCKITFSQVVVFNRECSWEKKHNEACRLESSNIAQIMVDIKFA